MLSIPTKSSVITTVMAMSDTTASIMESEEGGVAGYTIQPEGSAGFFVAKENADDIARFILFGETPDPEPSN